MSTLKFLIVITFAAFLCVFIGLHATAWAHSWYDAYCCNDQDCGPIASESVTRTERGYLWKNALGERLFPYDSMDLRISRDGQYHGCEMEEDNYYKRCLYVPVMG